MRSIDTLEEPPAPIPLRHPVDTRMGKADKDRLDRQRRWLARRIAERAVAMLRQAEEPRG